MVLDIQHTAAWFVVLISSVLQCHVCILRTVSQWNLLLVLCVIVFVVLCH